MNKNICLTTDSYKLNHWNQYPAGSKLGKEVATVASSKKIKHETRFVSNNKYTGDVMLYPESFLKEYFGVEIISLDELSDTELEEMEII